MNLTPMIIHQSTEDIVLSFLDLFQLRQRTKSLGATIVLSPSLAIHCFNYSSGYTLKILKQHIGAVQETDYYTIDKFSEEIGLSSIEQLSSYQSLRHNTSNEMRCCYRKVPLEQLIAFFLSVYAHNPSMIEDTLKRKDEVITHGAMVRLR